MSDKENTNTSPVEEDLYAGPKPAYYGGTIAHHLNHLLGKLLTVVDASIADPIQRKAMKDIIKTEFYDASGKLRREPGIRYISNEGQIGEIFQDGSRSIDPELDLKENGHFKTIDDK